MPSFQLPGSASVTKGNKKTNNVVEGNFFYILFFVSSGCYKNYQLPLMFFVGSSSTSEVAAAASVASATSSTSISTGAEHANLQAEASVAVSSGGGAVASSGAGTGPASAPSTGNRGAIDG